MARRKKAVEATNENIKNITESIEPVEEKEAEVTINKSIDEEVINENNNKKVKKATKKHNSKKKEQKSLNTNRPIYLYDFNGTLVGRFRGPTEAAKRLLGYNRDNVDIHDAHKLASLRSELSLYARNNIASRNGVVFVQGYVPCYEELSVDEIVNNRKSQNTRGNKVLQYDFNGNLMNIYENASDAAEKLSKSTAWVSILCNANFILRYDR